MNDKQTLVLKWCENIRSRLEEAREDYFVYLSVGAQRKKYGEYDRNKFQDVYETLRYFDTRSFNDLFIQIDALIDNSKDTVNLGTLINKIQGESCALFDDEKSRMEINDHCSNWLRLLKNIQDNPSRLKIKTIRDKAVAHVDKQSFNGDEKELLSNDINSEEVAMILFNIGRLIENLYLILFNGRISFSDVDYHEMPFQRLMPEKL